MATITTAFWHPFADMGAVSRRQLTIERGEGGWGYDSEDNRYLDATASLWYATIGHARPEVADAVSAQMRRLEAYSTFGDFGNHPANELCARLAGYAPMEDARILLCSGGARAPPSPPPPRPPAATSSCRGRPSARTSSRAPRAITARTASAPRSAGSR